MTSSTRSEIKGLTTEEVRGIPRRMLKTGPNMSTSGNLKSQIETERPQRDTLEKHKRTEFQTTRLEEAGETAQYEECLLLFSLALELLTSAAHNHL